MMNYFIHRWLFCGCLLCFHVPLVHLLVGEDQCSSKRIVLFDLIASSKLLSMSNDDLFFSFDRIRWHGKIKRATNENKKIQVKPWCIYSFCRSFRSIVLSLTSLYNFFLFEICFIHQQPVSLFIYLRLYRNTTTDEFDPFWNRCVEWHSW